eukprot:EG_transcript_27474
MVYHGLDNRTGARAALHQIPIKVHDQSASATEELHRSLGELLKLHHPHLVSVLDVWEDAQALWYTTDFYGGGSLRTFLQGAGAVPVATARHWTRQLVLALLYLHTHSIIHRNISSGEVLLTADASDVILCETIIWNIRHDPRFALRPRQAERYLAP